MQFRLLKLVALVVGAQIALLAAQPAPSVATSPDAVDRFVVAEMARPNRGATSLSATS